MTTTRLVTADELYAMPRDGFRYDLVKGVLDRMAPAGGEHGEIALDFGSEVRNFVRGNSLGRAYGAESGFLLARDPDVVLAPDVAYVRADRLPPREQRRGYLPVAPDLVVEIVSPSESRRKVLEKVAIYLEHGVRLVWVAEPRHRRVTAHRPDGTTTVFDEDDLLDGEDVLPGFALHVATIFA